MPSSPPLPHARRPRASSVGICPSSSTLEGVAGRKVEDDEDHEAHSGQEERRDHEFLDSTRAMGLMDESFIVCTNPQSAGAERKSKGPLPSAPCSPRLHCYFWSPSGMNHSSAKEKNL